MTDEAVDQPKEQQGPELTLTDLNAIKGIIEVATQRGAFKANEISAVGRVYDKLAGFLHSIAKQPQQPESQKG